MTDKQPDPLRVADELDCHNARLDRQAAKVIRTQHAEIETLKAAITATAETLERKNVLLRQALEALLPEAIAHTTETKQTLVVAAIKRELSQ